ncbi:uncharacterized protein MYCFIDRAFT_136960 [Pseudocercospora fijiensis CIRAD86]|uniref:Enoyl reductase (ER) domain-containing protein n=1 Tax=Pseudocercospora fijiensis (strain CIRAD86) TaxID=383855 RepID=M2Z164_PSEFD|nr:uncharacterized protein MYCFIDRAFT_136960 [Pseudocercospora fijiensis CIRAD86]EME83580.1 hypothetical protein MYCFIDRAFT_136960 [Pseudocercospora fijiensis CIRAD86]
MATTTEHARTIRSAQLYDAGDLRIEKVPVPTIPPKHVAIATKFCGICGSDLHFYHEPAFAMSLKHPHPLTGCTAPIAFGHEFAGVVAEIGEGCSGELQVGDKVAAMATLTDGTCTSCVEGHDNTCIRLGFVGINTKTGGMSEITVVAEDSLLKLPPSIDCDVGALIEPLAVAWHGVRLAENLSPTSSALIIGAGPVGCAVLLSLKAQNLTKIAISDPSPEKRKFVSHLGASATYNPFESEINPSSTLPRDSFDVVFDCAGVPTSFDTAIASIKPRRTVINLAIQETPVSFNLMPMVLKEVGIKSSIAYTKRDYLDVISAIEGGRLDARALITKRIKLEDVVEEGFLSLRRRGNVDCKVLVDVCL